MYSFVKCIQIWSVLTIRPEDIPRDLFSVYVMNDLVLASSPGGRRHQVYVRPVELERRVSFVSFLHFPKTLLVILGLVTAVVTGVENNDDVRFLLSQFKNQVSTPSQVGDPTALKLPNPTNLLPPRVKLLKRARDLS